MAERYKLLFKNQKILYSCNAPICVEAYALLNDTEKDTIVAQFKFRSVSEQNISALIIGIEAFDITGAKVDGVERYQYLDLNISRNQTFGDKKAIVLPNKDTRKIKFKIESVVFDNESQWVDTDQRWTEYNIRHSIEDELPRKDYRDEYKKRYGNDANYFEMLSGDLWNCVCGCINHEYEEQCALCKRVPKYDYSKDDIEKVIFEKNQIALQNEKEKQRREKAEQEKKHKRNLRLIKWLITIVAALVFLYIGFTVYKFYEKNNELKTFTNSIRQVNESFEKNDIDEAIKKYDAIDFSILNNEWLLDPVLSEEINICFKNILRSQYFPKATTLARQTQNEVASDVIIIKSDLNAGNIKLVTLKRYIQNKDVKEYLSENEIADMEQTETSWKTLKGEWKDASGYIYIFEKSDAYSYNLLTDTKVRRTEDLSYNISENIWSLGINTGGDISQISSNILVISDDTYKKVN